ncbi:hypothetical protein SISSUDRAFT_522441 [Sistotremastrum suecicum HHB10207 ss-3]|uniref:Uncharacterized protein n=1 Tax=Sistotremastrum suecicum HHB10207 ss-3 TaxID=1314776 RepID=A0A165XWX0_9AGAM|nr:hypothetical protein SISSUDRAFT_522441 [Sistotremastrum suecicum HHB10207 ss-3]
MGQDYLAITLATLLNASYTYMIREYRAIYGATTGSQPEGSLRRERTSGSRSSYRCVG